MKLEFLKDEKDEVKVKLVGEDKAVCGLIVETLSKEKEVEFAGCTDDHPTIGNPVITVKGKNAKKQLVDAIEQVRKELKELQKQVDKL